MRGGGQLEAPAEPGEQGCSHGGTLAGAPGQGELRRGRAPGLRGEARAQRQASPGAQAPARGRAGGGDREGPPPLPLRELGVINRPKLKPWEPTSSNRLQKRGLAGTFF